MKKPFLRELYAAYRCFPVRSYSTPPIQQAYADGKIADLKTYNKLYEVARNADGQVRKLLDILERQGAEEREEEARQLRIANGMEQ